MSNRFTLTFVQRRHDMKFLDLIIVAALCAAPCIVAAHSPAPNVWPCDLVWPVDLDHIDPKLLELDPDTLWIDRPYTRLLGAASPLTEEQWAWLDAIDADLTATIVMLMTPLSNCGDEAIRICGEGQVCCVCVTGNHNQSCSFTCRASDGSCQPCPPCVNHPVVAF